MRLTPAMVTALRNPPSPGRYIVAPLIEVRLPDYDLYHLVGAGEVMWGTKKFIGRDPLFGVLVAAGTLKDGIGDEAPDWDLTFVPPSEAAAGEISSADMQGSIVRGSIGVIDRETGLLLPTPLQLFAGTLDVPRLRVGKATRTLEWRCASVFDTFHDNDDGVRLSDAWHQDVWPGETGLANMSGIEKTSNWGVENPPSNLAYIGSRVTSVRAAINL